MVSSQEDFHLQDRAHAGRTRAIPEDSGIWSPADGPPSEAAGILGKQEAGKAIDAEDGADGDIPETQHEQTAS